MAISDVGVIFRFDSYAVLGAFPIGLYNYDYTGFFDPKPYKSQPPTSPTIMLRDHSWYLSSIFVDTSIPMVAKTRFRNEA